MKKILIAEDSNLMVSIIQNFIKKKLVDVKFVVAKNGEEAVSKYTSENPDVVFMDVNMPKMNGLDALEAIMKIDPHAKVIIITSKEGKEKAKAEEIGAHGFIEKPFSSSEIQEILKKALSY